MTRRPRLAGTGSNRTRIATIAAWVASLAGLPLAASAATIVECVDARGVAILTSSTTGAACTSARSTARFPAVGSATIANRAPTPADFPRVDAATQRGRDSDRARILRDELASEEGRLVALEAPPAASSARADAVVRSPAGPSRTALAEQLTRTRENIKALQRELAGVQ